MHYQDSWSRLASCWGFLGGSEAIFGQILMEIEDTQEQRGQILEAPRLVRLLTAVEAPLSRPVPPASPQ
eukprot:765955-Hanusia_phi.AAC.2